MTCPVPATGARTSHWYVAEVDCGTTPTSPTWLPLRFTSGGMQLTKDSLQSSELDGSREVADLRLGNNSVSGDISVELSYGAYNDLLQAALGGTWAQATALASLTITVDPAASKFTRSTGSFITDGVKVGDLVRFTGLVNAVNKAVYQIVRVSTTEVFVNAPASTLTTETSVASCGLVFPFKLGVGNTRRTISVLTHYADADSGSGEYHISRGVEITGFAFNVAVNALVTGTLSTIGMTYSADEALPSGSTFSSVTKTETYSNVDGVILDTTLASTTVSAGVIGYVTSLDMSLDNAASPQFTIGNDSVSFIERGRANSTLSLSAFFFDSTLLSRFVNETETAISVMLSNTSGNNAIKYGRVVYTSGAPEIAGEGSIMQTLEAQALVGAAGQSSIELQYLANP